MAKGEMVVRGDLNTATQSFVNAVTYMGGSVTSMNPQRPLEFTVRRTGSMMGGMGAPYSGTATLVPMGGEQTKVLLELKAKLWYTALIVAACIAVLSIGGTLGGDTEAVMTLSAIFAVLAAGTLYLYHVPWPQKLIERLQMGVHGAVPAYDTATTHTPQPVHAPQQPPAPTPQPATAAPAAGGSSSISDQLRQLAELRQQELITEAEHEAKRAELLKRL